MRPSGSGVRSARGVAEHRVVHAVAVLQVDRIGRAGIEFEHAEGRAFRGDQAVSSIGLASRATCTTRPFLPMKTISSGR